MVCGPGIQHRETPRLGPSVQVDRDSVVLDPGAASYSDHHHGPAIMGAQQMQAHAMPMAYMQPGIPGLPQYGRMDPAYGLQRPGAWPGPSLPAYGQPMHGGMAQQASLQAAAAAAFHAMAAGGQMHPGLPVPAVAGHADLPRQPPYSAAPPEMHVPQAQSQPPPPQQQPPSPQPGYPARGAAEAGTESGGSLSSELQQLVRQLALSQLGPPPDNT